MLRLRNPALVRLLTLLLALAVTTPAGSVGAMVRIDAASCEACCATLSIERGCSSASICTPAIAKTGLADDQTSTKPVGAWATGVFRPALPRAIASRTWASVLASGSLGPPSYLRFGRFLL